MRFKIGMVLFVVLFSLLIAGIGEAQAATLTYDADTLTSWEKQHLVDVGCTSNPNDHAERFYCEVKYVLYIYDDETDQEIALYFTDEKKMRVAAGQAFVKGWDWVEWERI